MAAKLRTLTPTTLSSAYGRVTVYAELPTRKSDFRNRKLPYTIVTANMTYCDDDQFPVYYVQATPAASPAEISHTIQNRFAWNVTNHNITAVQMRVLLIKILPLIAALKHYTHFVNHDGMKLVNAAAAVNACISHMSATAARRENTNV